MNSSGEKELQVLCDTGEITWEPLSMLRKDGPVSVVERVYQHNMQNKTGWRWAKKYAKRTGRFINLMLRANQLKQGPKKPTYKFGVHVTDSVP